MSTSLENITFEDKINIENLKGKMQGLGYTKEMIEFIIDELSVCKHRFYIGDDSGSMGIADGKYFNGILYSQCTRFEEMLEGLSESFSICSRAGINSEFISLNNGKITIKSGGNDNLEQDDRTFKSTFYTPNGGTPLRKTLSDLLDNIKRLPKDERKKLVLYSDGESSDGDITNIIKEIQSYNTSITIRLCTDESQIIQYWEKIDKQLEIRLDIIESYTEEKTAVIKINKDLRYTNHIHRLRQFGIISNDFDRMDETKLTESQINKINALNGIVAETNCTCAIM